MKNLKKTKNQIYQNLIALTLIITLLLSFVQYTQQVSQVVNWARYTFMKSGQHKLALATTIGLKSYNFSQAYSITFAQVPQVALGLIIMDFQASNAQQGFNVRIHSITTTSFISQITVNSGSTINELRYMYFGMNPTAALGVIYSVDEVFSSLNSNTAINGTEIINHSTSNTYNLSHTNLFVAFLQCWTITPQNGVYSIKVQAAILNTTAYKLTWKSNSTINTAAVSVLWADKTQVQIDKKQYVDYGYSFAQNNKQGMSSFDTPTSSFDYFQFIQGSNWFNINISTRFQVDFSPMPPLSMNSFSKYNYISKQLLHYRFRNCLNYRYYLELEQRCYDTCPTGYANQNTYNYCVTCHYSCLSCLTDGTTCLSCPSNVNRTKNGTTCPCDSGLFDNGVTKCSACDYTCLTCSVTSTKCLTCQSTRSFVSGNNTCPCVDGKFDQGVTTCSSCHYTCLTCKNSSTICLTCDNTNNHRILTSTSQCLCQSGYQDNGSGSNAICKANALLICSILCQTCSGNSTSCFSCKASQNRILSNKSCICKTGFGGTSNTCLQICGDGIIINAQCDDNNTIDGDGCSSVCLIQAGFKCNNTSPPSICIADSGYNIQLILAEKDLYSNSLSLQFNIAPIPPSSSIPTISNVSQQSLTFSFSGSKLLITLVYLQTILPSKNLKLSLSNIPTTLSFNPISSNKVLIRTYQQTYYTLFSVQNIMVYALIGLAWLIFLIQIMISKQSLGSSLQMMIGLSMVWIGVMGKPSLVLLYQPLTFLYYLFTYNIVLDTGCVLGVVNVGFWMNLITPFLFLIVLVISKFTRTVGTQSQKSFFLYDLFCAALCYNGVIVTYGLARQIVDQNLNLLSIVSLPFGVIYLIITFLITLLMILKQRRFPGMSSQLIRSSHYGFYLLIKYLSIFIYISLTKIISLNSLFVIGSSIIISFLIIFRKPYYENIRPLINQIFVFLVFSSYLIISQIDIAQWSGMMIIIFSFLYVIGNGILIFLQARRRDQFDKSDQQNEKINQAQFSEKSSQNDKSHHHQQNQNHEQNFVEQSNRRINDLEMQNYNMLRNNSGLRQPLNGQNQTIYKTRNVNLQSPNKKTELQQRFYQTNEKRNNYTSQKKNSEFQYYGNPMHQQ